MNLVWGTDRYSENMCTIVNIKVSCTSSDTEPWVITNADLTVDVQDSSSRPNLRTNITELSEFTNYTCTAIVTNIAGPSEESIEYSLRTAEEGNLYRKYFSYYSYFAFSALRTPKSYCPKHIINNLQDWLGKALQNTWRS